MTNSAPARSLPAAFAILPMGLAAQEPASPQGARQATATTPDSGLVATKLERSRRDDARVASQVAARLARHDGFADVATEVNGGVVTLSGTVLDEADRDLAKSLAASVDGVIAVQQRIGINASLRERVSPALEQVQD